MRRSVAFLTWAAVLEPMLRGSEQRPTLAIDINERYLAVARSNYPGRFIQADLPPQIFRRSVRLTHILVNSFLHHLPDTPWTGCLHSSQTLLEPQGRVHILELVRPERLSLPSMMASLDRGRYARTRAGLDRTLRTAFPPGSS